MAGSSGANTHMVIMFWILCVSTPSWSWKWPENCSCVSGTSAIHGGRCVPQQCPVAVSRGARLAARRERIAEIEQGVRIYNPVYVMQGERRTIAGNRVIELPGVAQHIRQVVMEHSLARAQCKRVPDACGRTR